MEFLVLMKNDAYEKYVQKNFTLFACYNGDYYGNLDGF